MARYREDLTGKKFGRLTVLEYYGNDKYRRAKWVCKCDCGNIKIVRAEYLKNGGIVSCGCYRKERIAECNTTHNLIENHRNTCCRYYNIISRCHDENDKRYDDYGGRGIKVCDRWRDDIRNFYDDVSKLEHFEEDGYSLDRIDNDGDYELNNVRWATIKEQNLNKRNTIICEYHGETRTLLEWSEIFDISYNILYQRVKRAGGDLESVIDKELLRRQQ